MSVLELVEEWLRLDKDFVTRTEIEQLVTRNDTQELERRMTPRIAFGTAGLRARMEAGFSRMNRLTVIQTSQGLAQYLLDNVRGSKDAGIVIGYDGRHNSRTFAEAAAAVFQAKGIKVWWYEDLVHTPMVPFGVVQLGAAAGIMITASHNPAMDNGYKVYGHNGCQINSPADKLIAASILANLEPITGETGQEVVSKLCNVSEAMIRIYLINLRKLISKSLCSEHIPRFVYTPLHGVGLPFMERALKTLFDYNVDNSRDQVRSTHGTMKTVESQAHPDPYFTTVKYPNPEEKGTLDLAMALADQEGINLILANDPDADRFAVAEKVNGDWYQFTGDQIGVLLGQYISETQVRREDPMLATSDKQQAQHMSESMIVLTSAVSSQMLACIGESKGFAVEETLTGFKWLGNRGLELGPKVIFAYEEALGYMLPQIVHDKDGIAAAMVFLQACSIWKSPWDKLQNLYELYGYFETLNTYWRCSDQALVPIVFADIRRSTSAFPVQREILRFRDLTNGTDTGTYSKKPDLPVDPNIQMLTFWLSGSLSDDGIRFTIRASGTEPKIKIYLECRSHNQEMARVGALGVLRVINAKWFNDPGLVLEEKYDLR
ncbi:Phosphoglucomutase-3 [Trapelia coarctata]|nr:Phosphoglucomutase-3 [Trapelia coarctata]